ALSEGPATSDPDRGAPGTPAGAPLDGEKPAPGPFPPPLTAPPTHQVTLSPPFADRHGVWEEGQVLFLPTTRDGQTFFQIPRRFFTGAVPDFLETLASSEEDQTGAIGRFSRGLHTRRAGAVMAPVAVTGAITGPARPTSEEQHHGRENMAAELDPGLPHE